jgi:opacity protein-like surface antigen
VALGVSAGYRFSPRMTAEIDASYVPRLELGEIPVCPIEMLCALASTATGPGLFRAGSYVLTGRAKSVSLVLVSQLPIRLGAMRPYVAGGGGFANVRRELRDSVVPFSLRRSSTDPMVTLGGGVDVPVGHKLIVGVDVRYERIFADQQFFRPDIDHDLNLTRVGSSIRYRF